MYVVVDVATNVIDRPVSIPVTVWEPKAELPTVAPTKIDA
jgi:hypothetical protein